MSRGTRYLYQIKTIRWSGRKGRKVEEFVTATNLEDVLVYLALDRKDEGVEIEAINRLCPILKSL
jgi:hypothetical protein